MSTGGTTESEPSDSTQGVDPGAYRRRRWPLVLAAIIALLLLGIATALALTVSPQDDQSTYPAGFRWEQHETGDWPVNRRWTVGVPDDLGPGEHPALVSLHPLGGNRSGWATETDLAQFAAQAGVIMVIPQGLWGMWNAGECCGPAAGLGVDDVGFLDEVMSDTARREDVDADRVYLAGLSNGGLMTIDYLCEGSFGPAGAAAVGVIPWDLGNCEGDVPLLVSIGTEDEVFPFDGGFTWAGLLASGRTGRSWHDASNDLIRAWGCTDVADERSFSAWSSPKEPVTAWSRTTYGGCNAPLTLVTVDGVAHTWLWGGDWSHTSEIMSAFGLIPRGPG